MCAGSVLSTQLASALRRPFTRLRGISIRIQLLHSSTRMRTTKGPSETMTAEWLRRILDDNTEAPRLYAWTARHLSTAAGGEEYSGESRSVSESGQNSSHTSITGYANHVDADDRRRRIYIMGVGNIGRLYAMCLSKLADRPPITLVVHRRELLEHWITKPGIELTRGGMVQRSAEFNVEWWTDVAPPPPPRGGHSITAEVGAGYDISNLIIATKAADAVPQIDRVRRYLGPGSAVAFAQNGVCKLWPPFGDVYVRARFPAAATAGGPGWIACVTTHGVTSQGLFRSTHASPADALVGPVTLGGDASGYRNRVATSAQMGYLMRQIAEAPDLDARMLSGRDLWVAQLKKLVVNTVINPLTAVLRCQNGELFTPRDSDGNSDTMPAVIDKLLAEASKTLSALILDSGSTEILASGLTDEQRAAFSRGYPDAEEALRVSRERLLEQFSLPQLREMVTDVGAKVAANTSSMLQDVRAGKPTEIDDLNGWLLDTARLLDEGRGNLQLPMHEKLVSLVKAQSVLTRAELCAVLLEAEAGILGEFLFWTFLPKIF